MVIEAFIDWFDFLCFDVMHANLKDKTKEHTLKNSINSYLTRFTADFDIVCHEEEFDIEKTLDYLKSHNEDIKRCIFGLSYDKRKIAKKELITKTISISHATTKEASSKIDELINRVLDIMYQFYIESVDNELLLANRVLSDELAPKIDGITSQLDNISSDISTLSSLGLTNDDIFKAQSGDNTGIEQKIRNIQNIIAPFHNVKGYNNQIYNGNLISVPVSPEANLNPPSIKATGKAKIGDKTIEEISDDVIDYAYRHQSKIEFTIEDAEKYLGSYKDPNQYEAKSIIGKTLVLNPQPFPEAVPVSIYCDNVVMIDFILLRLQEIMDDGTKILTNEEQNNSPFVFKLMLNAESKKTNISFQPANAKYAEDVLKIQHMLYMVDSCSEMTFKLLNNQSNFLEIKKSPTDERKLTIRKLNIEVLENIIIIEKYYNTKITLQENLTKQDYEMIKYLAILISKGKVERPWTEVTFPITIIENTKKNLTDELQELAYFAPTTINFWGYSFRLPIAITYKNAKIRDAERVLTIINQMKVGESFSITFIPDNQNGVCIHLLYPKGEEYLSHIINPEKSQPLS